MDSMCSTLFLRTLTEHITPNVCVLFFEFDGPKTTIPVVTEIMLEVGRTQIVVVMVTFVYALSAVVHEGRSR